MKKSFILFLSLFLFFACGYKEGVVQKAEKSYFKFVGNWHDARVEIDDLKPFYLDSKFQNTENGPENKPAESKLYQIAPGKHSIKIYKNNNLVVDRILLLDNQTILEVLIP